MDMFETDLVAHLPRLRAFARRLTRGDRALADDLAQDGCANALGARHRFTPDTNMGAWLTTILRNRFYSGVHRHRLRSQIADETIDRSVASTIPQHGRLAMIALEEAFNGLSATHREILVLAVRRDQSYEQIAERCRCDVGTVKSRVSRARARLREPLGEAQGDAA